MKRLPFRFFALVTFLLVFPFFLRRRPRVERRITILAPPSAIFPFLNDLRNWPLWTVWSRREEMHYTYGDITSGEGAEQHWSGCKMDGVMRIVRSEPDARIDYELEMDRGADHLFGRLELQPDGACTRVVWKCTWDRAENPYRCYFDLLLRWMIGRDFAEGLENLKVATESAQLPQPIAA